MEARSWIERVCSSTEPASWPGWGPAELSSTGLSGSLENFQGSQLFANNVALIAISLYVWEFALTLPAEIRAYFTQSWRSPKLVLLMTTRYSTLTALVIGGYSIWHGSGHKCVLHALVPTMLVQMSVYSVFTWRTAEIWKCDIRVLLFLGLLMVSLLVFSALLLMTLTQLHLPNGTCVLHTAGGQADYFFSVAWFYAGSLGHGLTLVMFSVYGFLRECHATDAPKWYQKVLVQWRRYHGSVRSALDDMMLIVLSTGFNAASFVVGLYSDWHARALLILYSSVMCIVCQQILLRSTFDASCAMGTEQPSDQELKSLAEILRKHPGSSLRSDAITLPLTVPSTLRLPVRSPDARTSDTACTILQPHDFQPGAPVTSLRPAPPSRPRARTTDEAVEYMSESRCDSSISDLEVADILANMTDNAKAVSLVLAGMEERPPPNRIYEPRYQSVRRPRTQWLMHPPLM